MDLKASKRNRRIGVSINYASILLLLILWYIGQALGWYSPILVAGMIAFLVIATASFIIVHINTGLWKLIHLKIEKLDERQVQITHEALRYSYAIFSVICLVILLISAVLGIRGIYFIDSVLVACLICLAHTLPSSVLAWTERYV